MKPAQFALTLLLILLAAGARFAHPRATPQFSSLDGKFLVATRKLTDPNFTRCVIFMIAHNNEGAMGLVVNRVFGAITLKDLFGGQAIGKGGERKVDLHYGGPVEFNRGFVLHSDDYTGASTQLFLNGIALSTELDVVQAVAGGHGPKRAQFLSGYTGWGAGQLEHEIARGDWLVAPADPELIFSADPDTVWEKALRHAGISL